MAEKFHEATTCIDGHRLAIAAVFVDRKRLRWQKIQIIWPADGRTDGQTTAEGRIVKQAVGRDKKYCALFRFLAPSPISCT